MLAVVLDWRAEAQVVCSDATCRTLDGCQRLRPVPRGQADGRILVEQLVCEDEVSSYSPLLKCGPAELLEALLVCEALHAVDVLGDSALDTFEHLYVCLQVRRPGLNCVLEMWPNVFLFVK